MVRFFRGLKLSWRLFVHPDLVFLKNYKWSKKRISQPGWLKGEDLQGKLRKNVGADQPHHTHLEQASALSNTHDNSEKFKSGWFTHKWNLKASARLAWNLLRGRRQSPQESQSRSGWKRSSTPGLRHHLSRWQQFAHIICLSEQQFSVKSVKSVDNRKRYSE